MTAEKSTAQEDLAFLRQLVSTADDAGQRRQFGRIYALWGLAFALPLLLEWGRMIGALPLPGSFWVVSAIAATALITIASIPMLRRAKPSVGAQSRAWNAVFAGVGWANVAVLIALFVIAHRLQDGRIMMIHAVVVFAFQGAAWYALWAIRKRPWTGLVAGGWYLAAAALGLTVGMPHFVLLCAIGLLLLMVAPGWAMMRSAAEDG